MDLAKIVGIVTLALIVYCVIVCLLAYATNKKGERKMNVEIRKRRLTEEETKKRAEEDLKWSELSSITEVYIKYKFWDYELSEYCYRQLHRKVGDSLCNYEIENGFGAVATDFIEGFHIEKKDSNLKLVAEGKVTEATYSFNNVCIINVRLKDGTILNQDSFKNEKEQEPK